MYLKAACTEIPVPRQRGGPRLDRCPSSIQQRQGAGTRVYFSSPTSPLSGCEASRPREQQCLDELLHVHSHLFQASGQPCVNMVYSASFTLSTLSTRCSSPPHCICPLLLVVRYCTMHPPFSSSSSLHVHSKVTKRLSHGWRARKMPQTPTTPDSLTNA
ncbi:hypothetical protein Q8A73_014827 [Channa argus]|nr:hypothetical protein Q8A73_014827 [Channa argus]